jgi:hypothetical protein
MFSYQLGSAMANKILANEKKSTKKQANKPQKSSQQQKPALSPPVSQSTTMDMAAQGSNQLNPMQLSQLQRTIGNQGVEQLLQHNFSATGTDVDTSLRESDDRSGNGSGSTQTGQAQALHVQRKANLLPKAEDFEKTAPPPSAYRDILRQMRIYEGLKVDDYRAQLTSLGKIRKMANNWTRNPPRLPAAKRLNIGLALLELRDNADKEAAEVTKQLTQATGTLTVPEGEAVEKGVEPKTGGIQGGVKKGTEVYTLGPDGKAKGTGKAFTNDAHMKFDAEVTLGGKKYYSLTIGADVYYVLKSKVTPAKHEAVQGWLFPHPPTVNDVMQGGLGDCYLLAAVQSVVSKNPADITNMMRDEGNTVTVRFYDVLPGPPKTFKAKYISISKSVMKSAGNQLYATGALWVPMLEKAYAAAGYQGMKTDRTTAKAKARAYSDIAGGLASIPLEHILGKSFDTFVFSAEGGQAALTSNPKAAKAGFTRLPWSDGEVTAYKEARSGFIATIRRIFGQKAKLYSALTSYQILKDADQVDTWIKFVEANKPLEDKFQKTALGPGAPADYHADIRLADVNKFFTSKGLEAAIAKKIINWLTSYRIYPGAVGSGIYTSTQIAFFERVRLALKSGGYVGLDTRKYVGKKSEGLGKSAGEQKSKGLVGGHAYTALGVKPNKEASKLKPTERLYITLRNPWGSYGRKYKEVGSELQAEESASAVFDLELSEVTEKFSQISQKI